MCYSFYIWYSINVHSEASATYFTDKKTEAHIGRARTQTWVYVTLPSTIGWGYTCKLLEMAQKSGLQSTYFLSLINYLIKSTNWLGWSSLRYNLSWFLFDGYFHLCGSWQVETGQNHSSFQSKKDLTGPQPSLEGLQSLSPFTECRPRVFSSASVPAALRTGLRSWDSPSSHMPLMIRSTRAIFPKRLTAIYQL